MKRVTFTEIDGDKPTGKGDYLRTQLTLRDESMEQTVIRYTGSPCPERWSVQSWYLNISTFEVNALNAPPEVVRSQD